MYDKKLFYYNVYIIVYGYIIMYGLGPLIWPPTNMLIRFIIRNVFEQFGRKNRRNTYIFEFFRIDKVILVLAKTSI